MATIAKAAKTAVKLAIAGLSKGQQAKVAANIARSASGAQTIAVARAFGTTPKAVQNAAKSLLNLFKR